MKAKLFYKLAYCLLTLYWLSFPCAYAQSKSPTGPTLSGNPKKTDARNAKIKSKPNPTYPEEGEKYNVTVVVTLKMILRASGEVTDISVLSIAVSKKVPDDVAKAFARESIKAGEKMKFEPAEKDGKKVGQNVRIEYNFDP